MYTDAAKCGLWVQKQTVLLKKREFNMQDFPELNLPPVALHYRTEAGKTYFFDRYRKKYIQLTPEEWVRQHFLYLLEQRYYPRTLLKTEGGLVQHKKLGRTDIVAYNRDATPFLLVECKRPEVVLSQEVINQAARYNLSLRAPHLAVTNGLKHQIFAIDFNGGKYQALPDLPVYRG